MPIETDYEIIITDKKGVIDSFSHKISQLLQFNPSFFKDN